MFSSFFGWPIYRYSHQVLLPSMGAFLLLGLTACDRVQVSQYDATATTIYTWQVTYNRTSDRPHDVRREQFASTSLVNRNGEPPAETAIGPDERGLWWPPVPPRPTVDQIEARQQNSQEEVGSPELIKTVNYTFSYEQDGATISLPTDHAVYRKAIQARQQGQPLEVTLGLNNSRVEDVQPVQ